MPGFFDTAIVTAGACTAGDKPTLPRPGRAEPHIGIWLIRLRRYVGYVLQEHGPALAHGDDEPGDIGAIREELPGIHRRHAIFTDEGAGVLHEVGGQQRPTQILRRSRRSQRAAADRAARAPTLGTPPMV